MACSVSSYDPETYKPSTHYSWSLAQNTPGKLVEQFSATMHLCWVDVALFP